MKVGRNEPCPCGSGLKVKRCCGVAGARRSHDAAEDLLGLAFSFPRSRPATASFDAWAAFVPDQPSREWLEAGGEAMGAEERERVVADFAGQYPHVWAGLLRDFRNDELAATLVVTGSVTAGVEERLHGLDPLAVELIEEEADPVEALALVLRATDLWNVLEAGEAVERFDAGEPIARVADALWTDWHDARLALLVGRLRGALPALDAAVGAFEADERVRHALRGELLLDTLPTIFDALRRAA